MKEFFVYVLRNSLDGQVFYVGKGSSNRYAKHLNRAANGSHLPVHKKIREILGLNGEILFEKVFYTLDEWEAFKEEIRLIALIGKSNLTNVTDGGEGLAMRFTEEHRRKLRESHLGKKLTAEAIAKRTLKQTGLKRSKETCKRISKALTGKKYGPLSREHKEKLSKAMTEESKELRRQAVRNMTPEQRKSKFSRDVKSSWKTRRANQYLALIGVN